MSNRRGHSASVFFKYRENYGMKEVFVVNLYKKRVFSRRIISKFLDKFSTTLKEIPLEAEDVSICKKALTEGNQTFRFKIPKSIKKKSVTLIKECKNSTCEKKTQEEKKEKKEEEKSNKTEEELQEEKRNEMARRRRNRRHRQRLKIIHARHMSSPPIELSSKTKCITLVGPTFNAGECKMKGKRPRMEDHVCVSINDQTSIFGIFDGHIGPKASKYSAREMPKVIRKLLESNNPHELFSNKKKEEILNLTRQEKMKVVLRAAFLTVNEGIKLEDIDDGTCATIVIIDGDMLYTANLGDSKAIIFLKDKKEKPIVLTEDHTPNNLSEKYRIMLLGGKVVHGRVGLFNITRSLGDNFQKYLSRDPHITQKKIEPEHFGIVVASDGVWNFTDYDEIKNCFFEEENPAVASKSIMNKAYTNGSSDNISVICIKFK